MTVSKKIISLLAVMAIIVSLSGCHVSNKNAAATEDGYMNTVKSYYGEWKLDNVFQIPDVSYMTEDEALSGENETVVIQSDSFASRVKLLYLPPYSPGLNPIEKMWSKIKSILRKLKARTIQALPDAIDTAFSAVAPSDCIGWFKSCFVSC